MDPISNYLESNSGRDKIFRLLSYTAKLLTACTSFKDTERKLKTFGSRMSECRIMLRLLDDVPTLKGVMDYGWGKQEPDWSIRWCQLIQNGLDLFYGPIEHITWAGQHKIVSINLNKWDFIGTVCWIISLQLSLMKSLIMLQKLQRHETNLANNYSNGCTIEKETSKKRLNTLLSCIRYTLDIIYAVNYLPPNMLWGGRLKTWHVGAFGTISSIEDDKDIISAVAENHQYMLEQLRRSERLIGHRASRRRRILNKVNNRKENKRDSAQYSRSKKDRDWSLSLM